MPPIPGDASMDASSSREYVQCGFQSPAYAVGVEQHPLFYIDRKKLM